MKKLFILLLPLLLFATRQDISFVQMQKYWMGKHTKTLKKNIISKKIIFSNATNSYSSTHFTIYWGDKNPATTLWADYDKDGIPDFITNSLSILENIWKKEIDEFGFNLPKSDHINIYIANTDITMNGKELTLSGNICGYSFYDGTEEFIILNDNPPALYPTSAIEMLRITLAHEFFHLIQYTYSINVSNLNKWLFEGTAVLMEHLVYPDIKDYIYSYADTIFNNPQYSFTNYFGLYPYSSVLFFDHLQKKYGTEIIKQIWEQFHSNSSFSALNNALTIHNSSLNKEIYQFYNDLEQNLSAFSNHNELSNYKLNKIQMECGVEYKISSYQYGAIYITNSCNNPTTFISEDISSSLSKNHNTFATNREKFIVIYPKSLDITSLSNSDILFKSYDKNYIMLKKGWNLVSFKEDITTDKFDPYPISLVWIYKDNKWYGYSPNDTLKKQLSQKNMLLNKIDAYHAVWINVSNDTYMDNTAIIKGDINLDLKKGWSLLSLPINEEIDSHFFSKLYNIKLIWSYTDNWTFYSTDTNLTSYMEKYGITLTKKLGKYGFWVLKD